MSHFRKLNSAIRSDSMNTKLNMFLKRRNGNLDCMKYQVHIFQRQEQNL